MNKTNIILILIFLTFLSVNLFAQTNVEVRVDGLACPFCAYGLEKKFETVEGIENLKIDFKRGILSFTLKDKNVLPEEEIRKKVNEAGFTPRNVKFIEIKIESESEEKQN